MGAAAPGGMTRFLVDASKGLTAEDAEKRRGREAQLQRSTEDDASKKVVGWHGHVSAWALADVLKIVR